MSADAVPPPIGSGINDNRNIPPLPDNDPEVLKLAEMAPAEITRQFSKINAILETKLESCSDTTVAEPYIDALLKRERFAECEQFAKLCHESNLKVDQEAYSRIFLTIAKCANHANHLDDAFKFYQKAIDLGSPQNPQFSATIFAFAEFAETTQYSEQAQIILSKNPAWATDEQLKVKATIELLYSGSTKLLPKDEVKSYIESQLNEPDSPYRKLLLLRWLTYIDKTEYRFHDLAVSLNKNIPRFESPDEWISLAYDAVFHSIGKSFLLASKIYEAYIPYATPTGWLPLEDNAFTYTELYSDKCANSLLQNGAAQSLEQIKSNFRSAQATASESLEKLKALEKLFARKADLLTMLGGMEEELGDDTLAQQYYWQAHLACPQYDRSHWGLRTIAIRQRQHAFKDFDSFSGRIKEILKKIEIPSSIVKYVSNWGSLTPFGRTRLEYAIRFWAPQIDLLAKSNHLYVKRGYELLSETPGMGTLRDTRIEMKTHEWDHRLWDDVRGAGGNPVIVDIDEMSGAPFGSFNLAGHEMGHQFEALLPEKIDSCILKLYAMAGGRLDFAEAYAASNEKEYFAQGVVYYMTPKDAPLRWGLNSQWLEQHDPDLLHFLDSIETAHELNAIVCPIKE